MSSSVNREHNFQILFFIFSAYFLPLGCIVLMEKTGLGQISAVNFILFGIEAASPTIAAIIAVMAFEKMSGIKAFFRLNFSPKLKASAVVASITIAFVIMLTAKFISSLILKTPFKTAGLTSKKLFIIAWAFIAEEIGWRGFLTKKLQESVSPMIVSLFVGLIWAFWHYHFFILGSIDVSIPLFIAGCVIDSYLYAALLKITKGNILIAMFFHMASNFFINIFQINPNVNDASPVPYAVYVIVSALFVVVISVVQKNRTYRN